MFTASRASQSPTPRRLLRLQAVPSAAQPSVVAGIGREPPGRVLHDTVLTTVGNTPIIRLSARFNRECGVPDAVNIFAKMEAQSPGGSVKDRLALGVLEWAERHGTLRPGQTVVEASSGNTGIGLAMACASKGHPFVCVMAESFSIERRKLMRFLGAKVVLTNPAHKGSGMVIKAQELARKHGWYLPRQFESEANGWVHQQTTGPEIVEAFSAAGEPLDCFVSAYGTGGTLLGVGRALRKAAPATRIVVCEPDNAPLLYSGIKTEYGASIAEGETLAAQQDSSRNSGGDGLAFKEPHPVWRPHLLQGWTPDFIPRLVDDALQEGLVDEVRHVAGAEAIAMAHALARLEGIASGTSGGGTLAAAVSMAKTMEQGNVLVMLADGAERYLSTPMFEDIPADMTEEEQAIAGSTPGAAPPPITMPEVTAEALSFVNRANQTHPVVVWSLEYCEFCWTITRLFDALGVKYRTINIDAFEHAKVRPRLFLHALLGWVVAGLSAPCLCPFFFFVAGQHG